MEQGLKVLYGPDFSSLLERVIEIDRKTLPAEYVTSPEKLEQRYAANPESFIGVARGGDLLGYINFFPIHETALRNIMKGRMDNDITLGAADVLPYSETQHRDLYIITVAVLPEWQNTDVIRIIKREFREFIREKMNRRVLIRDLYASVVSDDGDRFLRSLSFHPLKENPSCYTTAAENFLNC